jgi:hypothetical protein
MRAFFVLTVRCCIAATKGGRHIDGWLAKQETIAIVWRKRAFKKEPSREDFQ